jgi:uncharacterized Fe-S cluster-containing protein
MAIIQEMAEIYSAETEELCEYLLDIDCNCDYESCVAFAEALHKKCFRYVRIPFLYGKINCGLKQSTGISGFPYSQE